MRPTMRTPCDGSFTVFLANVFCVTPSRTSGVSRHALTGSCRAMATHSTRPSATASALPTRGLTTQTATASPFFALPPAVPRSQRQKIDASFLYEKVENKAPSVDAAIRAFRNLTNDHDQYIIARISTVLDTARRTFKPIAGKAVVPLGVLPKEVEEGESKDKVLVFAKGEIAAKAKEAGADLVGDEETIAEIQGGNLNLTGFTRCLCTPDMYQSLIKIARILGPLGLMPNAKKGTVTTDIVPAMQGLRAQTTLDIKQEMPSGMIASEIGKVSWSAKDVEGNIAAFLKAILEANENPRKKHILSSIQIGLRPGPYLEIPMKPFGESMKAARLRK